MIMDLLLFCLNVLLSLSRNNLPQLYLWESTIHIQAPVIKISKIWPDYGQETTTVILIDTIPVRPSVDDREGEMVVVAVEPVPERVSV